MNIVRWIAVVLLGLSTLAGCAKAPYRDLDAAEYMVSRARALEAPRYAPTEYQAAQAALQDARDAMQAQAYGYAGESLEFSLRHARRAITIARDAKAAAAVEEARRKAEAERLAEEQARPAEEQVRKPAAKPPKPVKPEPTPPPEPAKPASTYEVGEGETLWTIANQSVVYGDSLLWPLLYQANRDQIRDPRQVYPGQVLNIRRDLSARDIEDARQRALESDIFPVPRP